MANTPGEIPNEGLGKDNEVFSQGKHLDVEQEKKPQKKRESVQEASDDTEKQIEGVRKKLQGMDDREIIVKRDITPQAREEQIKAYQDRYLPPYLKGKKDLIGKLLTELYAHGVKFECRGVENIPEYGPFVVISNHFGGGEVEV